MAEKEKKEKPEKEVKKEDLDAAVKSGKFRGLTREEIAEKIARN